MIRQSLQIQSATCFLCSFLTAGLADANSARWIATASATATSGVTCIENQPHHVLVEFSLAGFSQSPVLIQGETWQQIRVPDAPVLQEAGFPELPWFSCTLQIPARAAVTVHLISSEYVDYPETPVAPSRGPLSRAVNPSDVPYTFNAFYQSAGCWPEQLAACSEPFILRDRRGITLRLRPFQYDAGRRSLRVYTHLTVEVLMDGENVVNSLPIIPERTESAAFQPIYSSFFLNSADSETRVESLPYSDDELLIIASTNYLSTLEPFVRWKRESGLHTALISLEETGTTATDIKKRVQQYFNTNGLTFLLLVGDAEDLPTFTASGGASDPTYSKLAGDDDYPDIFVGRFSGASTQDIEILVQRTISYEQAPAEEDEWYQRAVGIASNEDGGTGIKDREHMEMIRTNLLAHGYTQFDSIYDTDSSTALPSQVSNSVHSGRGVINYIGHGSDTSWSTTKFSSTDVNGLTNTTQWPFIFDVACVNGHFDGRTCFAEAWTRAENRGLPAGALAVYASSINQDWDPPVDALKSFNTSLPEGVITSFGGLCFNAALIMLNNWGESGTNMFNTWIVFGDPSVQVRTAKPDTLSVVHDPMIYGNQFCVHVEGISNAHVALTREDVLYETARTDAQGDAAVTLDSFPEGNVLLTVTAFNAVPYTSLLTVAQASLSATPSNIARHVVTNRDFPVSITVSNAGNPDSRLTYTFSLIPDYTSDQPAGNGLVSAFSTRSIAGSSVSLSPGLLYRGSNVTLQITVTNAGPDEEWLTGLTLRFPSGCVVCSVSDILEGNSSYFTCASATGEAATLVWQAPNTNMNAIIHAGTGTVNITLSDRAPESLPVGWMLQGDAFGSAPHSITGALPLTVFTPSLILLAPRGDEEWMIGSTQSILWTSTDFHDAVNISCSTDGAVTWTQLTVNASNSGSYAWTVDTVQTSNALIRINSTDETLNATSAAPFKLYRAIDWIYLDTPGGTITGSASEEVFFTLSASNKTPGTYRAYLRVTGNTKSIDLPVEMTVTLIETVWRISLSANGTGSIAPTGYSNTYAYVTNGQPAWFLPYADSNNPASFIVYLAQNDSVIQSAVGTRAWTCGWNQVVCEGTIDVAFMDWMAYGDTPVPWLRSYYENETSLNALIAHAYDDTDADGLSGWQEYGAGTDPTNAASTLRAVPVEKPDEGDAPIITWPAVTGRVYSVYKGTNLFAPFIQTTNNLTVSAEGLITYTGRWDDAAAPLYYRIQVQP